MEQIDADEKQATCDKALSEDWESTLRPVMDSEYFKYIDMKFEAGVKIDAQDCTEYGTLINLMDNWIHEARLAKTKLVGPPVEGTLAVSTDEKCEEKIFECTYDSHASGEKLESSCAQKRKQILNKMPAVESSEAFFGARPLYVCNSGSDEDIRIQAYADFRGKIKVTVGEDCDGEDVFDCPFGKDMPYNRCLNHLQGHHMVRLWETKHERTTNKWMTYHVCRQVDVPFVKPMKAFKKYSVYWDTTGGTFKSARDCEEDENLPDDVANSFLFFHKVQFLEYPADDDGTLCARSEHMPLDDDEAEAEVEMEMAKTAGFSFFTTSLGQRDVSRSSTSSHQLSVTLACILLMFHFIA